MLIQIYLYSIFSDIIRPLSKIGNLVDGVRIWKKSKPELILFRLDLKIS